jgi:hypothetical protein
MIPPTPPRDAGPAPAAVSADAGPSSNDAGQRDGPATAGTASQRGGNATRQPRRGSAGDAPPDDPARQQFQALMQGLPLPGGVAGAAPGAVGELAPPGPAGELLLPQRGPAPGLAPAPMPLPQRPEGARGDAQGADEGLAPALLHAAAAALPRPGSADDLTRQVSVQPEAPDGPKRPPADLAQAAPEPAADHGAAHRRHAASPWSPEPEPGASKSADPLPSPMDLFQPRVAEPPAAAPTRPDAAANLPQAQDVATQLALRIERLAVSQSDDGQRRVRLAVGDGALPDTDIEIGEAGGEMQVMFFCRSADTRRLLEPQASALASDLADRLQRPVWVSVGGLQRDEPGRTQVHAQPGAAAGAAAP